MPPLKDLIGKKPSASEPTEIDPVGRDLMNAMLAHFKPKFEDPAKDGPDKAQGKDDPAKDPATGANPTTEE